jgi:hypothetical protein
METVRNKTERKAKIKGEDDARNDLRKMGVKIWKQRAQERKQWKEIIEQAKTQKRVVELKKKKKKKKKKLALCHTVKVDLKCH